MNKFQALLRSFSGLALDGSDSLSDTFRALPASVSGAAGAMHRYCAALLITAKASFTYSGEGTPPVINSDVLQQLLDVLIPKITWSRYGGMFIPQQLRASQIASMIGGLGCVTQGKGDLLISTPGWTNNVLTVYASILVPTTPTMYSTGHTVGATDAPWSAALLGASSTYTLSGGDRWVDVDGFDDPDTDLTSAVLEVSAQTFDTPDVYIARPIEYRIYKTGDDPAILPAPYCKMPLILCTAPGRKAVTAYLNDAVVPVVRVDGRQLQERQNARTNEIGNAWYRDDGDRMFVANANLVLPLRTPFESSKMINQPAGSKWTVEGVGSAQGGAIEYLYVLYSEPDPSLISYQLSQMGIDQSSNRIGNLTINSNERSEMALTEEEAVGIPHRLGSNRFKG